MESLTVKVTTKNNLQIITLNNPKIKNALSVIEFIAITKALKEAAQNESISIVALTGAGDFFSSGGNRNLSILPEHGAIYEERKNILRNMIHEFIDFPKPIIAVVNGPAIGTGATILALCDVIYSLDTAYFYTPFTKMAISTETCSSYLYPRIFGKSKASEMLYFNHKMSAKEALRYNFVSDIFSKSELDTKIWPQIEEFAKLPKKSMEACKKLSMKWDRELLKDVYDMELEELKNRRSSEEFRLVRKLNQKKSKL